MAASRKRPREENEDRVEDNRAECRFSVKIINPRDKENDTKRRRTDGGQDEDASQRVSIQLSPFSPSGKFRTNSSMDLHYQVEPAQEWADMTRYNSFVRKCSPPPVPLSSRASSRKLAQSLTRQQQTVNGVKYFSEGFIYVANDSSMKRERAGAAKEPIKKSDDDWVARILEIRASDEHHVYARVYWMYWPDELPRGSRDGRKIVRGRQPYHGTNELIASNHSEHCPAPSASPFELR